MAEDPVLITSGLRVRSSLTTAVLFSLKPAMRRGNNQKLALSSVHASSSARLVGTYDCELSSVHDVSHLLDLWELHTKPALGINAAMQEGRMCVSPSLLSNAYTYMQIYELEEKRGETRAFKGLTQRLAALRLPATVPSRPQRLTLCVVRRTASGYTS